MKPLLILATIAVFVGVSGCEAQEATFDDNDAVNPLIVRHLYDVHVNNAIVRQQTIFPYHFGPNSTDLNDLGRHDLRVLTAYYRQYPGKLNVRRSDGEDELYDARVQTVVKALADGGVEMDRVTIADERPRGDGMISERVVTILTREKESTAVYSSKTLGTSGSTLTGAK